MQALPAGTLILGVNPGFTRTNKQKFDVQCSDGNVYTTFRPDVASKAQAAVNQQGLTIMVSFKDQYKNFEDVLPGGAAIPQGFAPPQQQFQPQQQFTPAAGFVDAKEARIIRGNGVNAASAALAPLIGTGAFLNDDGDLDTEALATQITTLAGFLARYIDNGPVAPAADADAAPALPPGVTPDQMAAWAQAQGAAVQVGAPVQPEAPADGGKAY